MVDETNLHVSHHLSDLLMESQLQQAAYLDHLFSLQTSAGRL